MAGIPLSIRPAHRPRAVLPPWTYHQPQWPWRQEAYACVRTFQNDIHVLALVGHTHSLTLCDSQKRAITGSLSKLLKALSHSHMRVDAVRRLDVSLKLDVMMIIRTVRDIYLWLGENLGCHCLCIKPFGWWSTFIPTRKNPDRKAMANIHEFFSLKCKRKMGLIDSHITSHNFDPWMCTSPESLMHLNQWPLPQISPVSHSPRASVPSGLTAEGLLVFLSHWGGLSHCSVGLSLLWPGRVGVIECTEECRPPRDPRPGVICNYLLQCSGRLQFALVQDVDYLVY